MSSGTDEIFALDYMPTASFLRQVEQHFVLVQNDDGLLDIPLALILKKQGRTINMVTLTKEDKLKAKLMLVEKRMKT